MNFAASPDVREAEHAAQLPAAQAVAGPAASNPSPGRPGSAQRTPSAWTGVAVLLLVTAIWGSTFPVVKALTVDIQSAELLFLRFSIAGLLALPVLYRRWPGRIWLRPALEFGLLGWLGYAAQTEGLRFTSSGRSAFITALSVLGVPLLATLLGQRQPRRLWLAVGLALGGAWLLVNDGAAPNKGDALTLLTALSYSVYILRLEAWVQRLSAAQLMAAQTLGVLPFAALALWVASAGDGPVGLQAAGGLASLVAPLDSLIRGWAAWPPEHWLALVYLGTVGLGLTAALQAIGQARVSGAQAALLFTTEPVWAAFFAWLWLGEVLGPTGLLGAGLILGAAWWGQGLNLEALRQGPD